jgi:hypothetical protein
MASGTEGKRLMPTSEAGNFPKKNGTTKITRLQSWSSSSQWLCLSLTLILSCRKWIKWSPVWLYNIRIIRQKLILLLGPALWCPVMPITIYHFSKTLLKNLWLVGVQLQICKWWPWFNFAQLNSISSRGTAQTQAWLLHGLDSRMTVELTGSCWKCMLAMKMRHHMTHMTSLLFWSTFSWWMLESHGKSKCKASQTKKNTSTDRAAKPIACQIALLAFYSQSSANRIK